MLDQPIRMQRVKGAAHVRVTRAGLADLRQQGSAKAMLPRTDDPDPEVVFLNTAGGVTGGDRLDYSLQVGAGARVTGATQTAERAYRARDAEHGVVATEITVGKGARLDWLPQELIVFDGAAIRRDTTVTLSGDATVLAVDSVVLGRAAHGEVVTRAILDDIRTIRRDGRLVHQEHLALDAAALADPAALGGNCAMATLVFLGQGAEDALGPLRDALGTDGHASAWDGRLVARLVAPAAAPLRRALIRAILPLRGRAVPRVWQSDL
ncbi:urease accessory protein UreD [Jannaschia sp. M317]|uniref:urease accessory protein UreD n=1 Tax=Jannaschia sp. M317 TaxID=2867011 RepID=UPI0021A5E72F|nr:urease accessory protein UreD [Jannaschia sp. M317]UWQ16949.1 urease accessory protein UreD [Jannaschia sp. M317]